MPGRRTVSYFVITQFVLKSIYLLFNDAVSGTVVTCRHGPGRL